MNSLAELRELLDRLEDVQRALENIAGPDDLVDANEDAFSVHAFRRCQEVARYALERLNGDDA